MTTTTAPIAIQMGTQESRTESDISQKTLYRLSIYYRCLNDLALQGRTTVVSQRLSALAGVKPSQLRSDLARIGRLGRPGLGYDIESLQRRISKITRGPSPAQPLILVGVGNLGRALLNHGQLIHAGHRIVAAFDKHESSADFDSVRIAVHPMKDLKELVDRHNARVAILATPLSSAREVTDYLVSAGIRGILNFTGARLSSSDKDVYIRDVDLASHLASLSYFANRPETENPRVRRVSRKTLG